MHMYKVKLNAWISPCYVWASTKKIAADLALKAYPKCDCCGAATTVEHIDVHHGQTPFYTKVIVEVKQ